MAYDPDNHVVDPDTGMLRHKDTGHLIGIEQVPAHKSEPSDWPKWVEPHASHRVLQGDHVVVQGFDDFHVARDGRVTVLCRDEDDEERALAALEVHASEVE